MDVKRSIVQAARSALLGLLAAALVLPALAGISVVIFGFDGWEASWGGPMLWLLPLTAAAAVGLLVGVWAWRISPDERGD